MIFFDKDENEMDPLNVMRYWTTWFLSLVSYDNAIHYNFRKVIFNRSLYRPVDEA